MATLPRRAALALSSWVSVLVLVLSLPILVGLAANSTRRPAATLTIVTEGALTLASDGFASEGRFSAATGRDKLSVNCGQTLVSIALDLGNNGSVDRTWTLERAAFFNQAG